MGFGWLLWDLSDALLLLEGILVAVTIVGLGFNKV